GVTQLRVLIEDPEEVEAHRCSSYACWVWIPTDAAAGSAWLHCWATSRYCQMAARTASRDRSSSGRHGKLGEKAGEKNSGSATFSQLTTARVPTDSSSWTTISPRSASVTAGTVGTP